MQETFSGPGWRGGSEVAQGSIADREIRFEGKGRDTKPLLAALSLARPCMLSCAYPLCLS